MLRVQNISKAFGETVAVNDVSLDVPPGETVGLLGVNGAGKTTIMNMILGLTTPSSGTIEIFGMDLAHHRIEILRRTNFCTTYAALPSNLKVRSNLKIFGHLYGVRNPGAKADELLELLEIPHLANKITGHLSAGESTRVNLVKALLNDPDLLLLDEPTASLDPDIADKVRQIVCRVQQERSPAILYTSHNMKDIEVVCDRVYFLHEGSVLAAGTAEDLKSKFERDNLDDVFIRIARNEIEELQIG